MARIGSFSGPSQVLGSSLSYTHPPDNDFGKSRYHQLLNDPALGLDETIKSELQKEIEALFEVMRQYGQS